MYNARHIPLRSTLFGAFAALIFSLLLISCGGGDDGPGSQVNPGPGGSGENAGGASSGRDVLSPASSEAQLAAQFDLRDLGEARVGLTVKQGRVKSGQTLSHLLSPHGVSAGVIHGLDRDGREVFDARRIRADHTWWMFKSATGEPLRFVYSLDQRIYVVFNLEKPDVRKGKLPMETTRHTAIGIINQSLSQDMEDAGQPVSLTLAMAAVYAWTVDFSRLHKGDRYKIIYEQDRIAGKPYGMPEIVAATFTHQGKILPAYRFHQGDKPDFFDDEGASLRKAFLKAPLEFSRISSHYNKKRFHPVLNRIKPHLGTDYAAPTGTPILAVGDGVVTKASYTKGNGKYVKIRHNSTYDTQYLHMSKRKVKKGDRVSQGDVIGYVGSTGLATGPHVCFRFWKHGVQVNHLKEDFPPSDPILPDYANAFAAHAKGLRAELAKL